MKYMNLSGVSACLKSGKRRMLTTLFILKLFDGLERTTKKRHLKQISKFTIHFTSTVRSFPSLIGCKESLHLKIVIFSSNFPWLII